MLHTAIVLRLAHACNSDPHQGTDTLLCRPAEIIVDGQSGFHIDPYHGDEAANLMADFFEGVHEDEKRWIDLSDAALERIYSK